jgi:hypothetical protein
MDKMLETREVIYQLNALFYGYADKDTWPGCIINGRCRNGTGRWRSCNASIYAACLVGSSAASGR